MAEEPDCCSDVYRNSAKCVENLYIKLYLMQLRMIVDCLEKLLFWLVWSVECEVYEYYCCRINSASKLMRM